MWDHVGIIGNDVGVCNINFVFPEKGTSKGNALSNKSSRSSTELKSAENHNSSQSLNHIQPIDKNNEQSLKSAQAERNIVYEQEIVKPKTQVAQVVEKKEPCMLSEILNFLDDANQAANSNSPMHALNSETESTNQSNGGGHQNQKGGCETVNKLHGMTKTERNYLNNRLS